jgi:hypothetical protein
LDYQTETQTLIVQLMDPPPAPVRSLSRPFAPEETKVPPGETATLTVPVPVVLKKIHPSTTGGLGNRIERIDISGLKKVQCRIGYGETPIPSDPSDSTERMRARLHDWARITEAVLPPVPAGAE